MRRLFILSAVLFATSCEVHDDCEATDTGSATTTTTTATTGDTGAVAPNGCTLPELFDLCWVESPTLFVTDDILAVFVTADSGECEAHQYSLAGDPLGWTTITPRAYRGTDYYSFKIGWNSDGWIFPDYGIVSFRSDLLDDEGTPVLQFLLEDLTDLEECDPLLQLQ